MDKIIAFGEILLRLSTQDNSRFVQARSFAANYGGSEFNVIMSLADFGKKTAFISKLPKNVFGNQILEEMRKKAIETNDIIRSNGRLGLYFMEKGNAVRSSCVLYDRENSLFANISSAEFDWDRILDAAKWFHWSGITPAVSQEAANVCKEALAVAKSKNITVSCDLNYRSKLWNYGKQPQDIMPELLRYTDVILGDLDTACMMTGMEKLNPDYSNLESIAFAYDHFLENFPNVSYMGTTLRYSLSASHQKIGGILYDKNHCYSSRLWDILPVVDRVGTGDAFMAGLIHGLLEPEASSQYAVDFATAACSFKHTVNGDYGIASVEEIEKMITQKGQALVDR
ncbi:sugar kinase [Galbibacter sp. BG1]|uniref:sugar kinase n=1 Tax=Galbibacter sp. BG1 TaxID=1170699 RepID=UPI0015B8AB1D|nr:sugar kinase [Galbibacter sp. BG1]QLE02445.1 sugar kinase [Galbibacter sp. BG1]